MTAAAAVSLGAGWALAACLVAAAYSWVAGTAKRRARNQAIEDAMRRHPAGNKRAQP